MKKLKELALQESRRRRVEQEAIQKEKEAIAKKEEEAKALAESKVKEELKLIEATQPRTAPAKEGFNIDHSEDKTYRFTLSSCYHGTSHFLELSCDTDTTTKVVTLKPKLSDMTISVDNDEMAEDMDGRYDLLKDWSHRKTVSTIPTEMILSKGIKRVVDSGIVEYGSVIDTGASNTIVEMFLAGSRVNGLLRFERMDNVTDTNLSKEWFATFQGSSSGIRPYILSNDAMRVNYITENNSSCLPRRMKKRVPFELRYWNEPERVGKCLVRNNLSKQLDEGKVFLPLGEETNGRYSVIKVWTPRESEFYHLQVQNRGLFKALTNSDITNFNKLDAEIILTNSDTNFGVDDYKEGTIELSAKPQFARAIDWGDCVVFENNKNRKTIKFLGAKMRDVLQFTKMPQNAWKVTVLESNRTSGQDLNNSQIDEIIEMSKAKAERNEIAEKINCSPRTVYTYQKILGYV